ncbi:MAG: carboxylating nicotinate-nucleotide diphosphorylase [Ignavibacteriae bacterium]|nr:carboxylating nicotinate-nucleotide diphosphorylase [Ignavibacteriota bacterium]
MTNRSRHNKIIEVHKDSRVTRLIEQAIQEDLGMGDVTTDAIVPPDLRGRAEIVAKESGVLAGLEYAAHVFEIIDSEVEFKPLVNDGSFVQSGTVVASLEGALASILKGERTALNILQRMSGIATLTRKFVDAVKGMKTKITDTRKTAPGLRVLDKHAVQFGGGVNHRFGLDDMVLIKDNHIAAVGEISAAIERCLHYVQQKHLALKIEVETKNLQQVEKALKHKGLHCIMLDNFTLDEMRKAVKLINHAVEVEASGNVTLENVRAIAETGVDFISIGALTHSPKALDISLKIVS